MKNPALERVHIPLDASDWHGHGGENLWADHVKGDLYVITNLPFFDRGINNKDVVRVVRDPRGSSLLFDQTVELGGHSTFMILADENEPKFRQHWLEIEACGCTYESMSIVLSIVKKAYTAATFLQRLIWLHSVFCWLLVQRAGFGCPGGLVK